MNTTADSDSTVTAVADSNSTVTPAANETSLQAGTDESVFHQMPFKFTVLDVPGVDDPSDFENEMLKVFRIILAFVSTQLDGIGFSDAKISYIRKASIVEDDKNFRFYYDASVIISNPESTIGSKVIDAVRQYRLDILQIIQEYKTDYYYVDDFEVCTPSVGENNNLEDRMFDLCSYDHQVVPVEFSTVGLSDDFGIDQFNEKLVEMYNHILRSVNGLDLAGIYADTSKVNGNTIDFYHSIDIMQRENRNMKSAVVSTLESEDTRAELLEYFHLYTDTEVCITEEGRYSVATCVLPQSKKINLNIRWQILTVITASVVLVCGFCISAGLILRQRKREEREFNNEIQTNCRERHVGLKRRDSDDSKHRCNSGLDHERPNSDHRDERLQNRHREHKRYNSDKRHKRRRTECSDDSN